MVRLTAMAWIVLAAGVGQAVGAAASQPAARATDEQIVRWVRQLGADRFEQREAAERALRAVGAPARARLEAALEYPDAEVAERARRILAWLAERQADDRIAAGRVTAAYRQATLAEVLADLTRRTGNPIVDTRDPDGAPDARATLSIELDNLTWWQALDRVLAAASVRDDVMREAHQVCLVPGRRPAPPTCYDGPCRFQLVNLTAQRDFRAMARTLTAQVILAWEPRLRPLTCLVGRQPTAAEDDTGVSLVDSGRQGWRHVPVGEYQTTATRLVLQLAPAAPNAGKLARLEGVCRLRLPGKRSTFTFERFGGAAGRELKADGVKVVLESARAQGQTWLARLRFEYPEAGEEHESHRSWQSPKDIQLVHRASARRLPVNGGHNITQRRRGVQGFEFIWTGVPGAPADYDLQATIPTMLVTREVRYRFKDVPLP